MDMWYSFNDGFTIFSKLNNFKKLFNFQGIAVEGPSEAEITCHDNKVSFNTIFYDNCTKKLNHFK